MGQAIGDQLRVHYARKENGLFSMFTSMYDHIQVVNYKSSKFKFLSFQESILHQTVYIHLLNQTDIRQVHTSLFYRKDCIGIFCIA